MGDRARFFARGWTVLACCRGLVLGAAVAAQGCVGDSPVANDGGSPGTDGGSGADGGGGDADAGALVDAGCDACGTNDSGASSDGGDAGTDPTIRLIFVTSTPHAANFGGLTQGDAICQTEANNAKIAGTYKAWLSDESTSAAARLAHFSGPYKRIDGTTVAKNWSELASANHQAPISVTASGGAPVGGTPTNTAVWAGTDDTGGIAFGSGHTCSSWGSSSSAGVGVVGNYATTNDSWTFMTNLACDGTALLYCIQQ